MKYLADIYIPNHSLGLMVDANIIKEAIGRDKVRIISYPFGATERTIEINDKLLKIESMSTVAIFLERIFDHKIISSYKRRILIPNIEWLTSVNINLTERLITDIWHKSYVSHSTLSKILPKKTHLHIGFTSFQKVGEIEFDKFAHFSGKSKTRHTQEIVDIWLDNDHLPLLTLQTYSIGVNLPLWVNVSSNLRLYSGFLNEKNYNKEFAQHGVHLCTSQMEGYGHYINESRSLGALILILDAAPMNELIDTTSGILIPTIGSEPHYFGTRHYAASKAIKEGIVQALEMSNCERAALGGKAKFRYAQDRVNFMLSIKNAIYSASEN